MVTLIFVLVAFIVGAWAGQKYGTEVKAVEASAEKAAEDIREKL